MRRAPERVEGAGPKRGGGMAVRESGTKATAFDLEPKQNPGLSPD